MRMTANVPLPQDCGAGLGLLIAGVYCCERHRRIHEATGETINQRLAEERR